MSKNLNQPTNSPLLRKYKVKEGMVALKGEVQEALPNTLFRVVLENEDQILARLGGRMRKNYIRVSPGDIVIVELEPDYNKYEKPKGRIIFREK